MGYFTYFVTHPGLIVHGQPPADRGKFKPIGVAAFGTARWGSDSIGTTTVTFSGVNAGSEIRVYLPDGTAHAGVESCDANPTLTWAYYAANNNNNNVTIRIVHPSYKIKEFVYTTLQAATQSIPVQQEVDRWYSNPA